MFALKSLSSDSVPAALEKAVRYRLLNEPEQAESICQDVLLVEPGNAEALTTLILALSDRFYGRRPSSPQAARELLPRLPSEYDRVYYAGIIAEREGIAWLRAGKPRAGQAAYDCFRQAMSHYEAAEALRPSTNDDARLRWNSCARLIMSSADIAPPESDAEIVADLGE